MGGSFWVESLTWCKESRMESGSLTYLSLSPWEISRTGKWNVNYVRRRRRRRDNYVSNEKLYSLPSVWKQSNDRKKKHGCSLINKAILNVFAFFFRRHYNYLPQNVMIMWIIKLGLGMGDGGKNNKIIMFDHT